MGDKYSYSCEGQHPMIAAQSVSRNVVSILLVERLSKMLGRHVMHVDSVETFDGFLKYQASPVNHQ